jgi:hypothetical protein
VLSFEPFMESMQPDLAGDPPPAGSTDLRAMTMGGRVFVRAKTDEFGNGQHPMSTVFHAGQALISELRRVADRGGGTERGPGN